MQAVGMRALDVTMGAVGICSLLVAMIFSRAETWLGWTAKMISLTLYLFTVNLALAFAGCGTAAVTRTVLF